MTKRELWDQSSVRKRFDPKSGRVQLRLDRVGQSGCNLNYAGKLYFMRVARSRPAAHVAAVAWLMPVHICQGAGHCGRSCGAVPHLRDLFVPAGSAAASSRRTLRQWCSGGVGPWSCRPGTADVPAVRGRTCATFLFLRVAQPRPRGARCGSGVPEVLALVLQARHCGRSCSAGTHLRYPVPMFPQVTP